MRAPAGLGTGGRWLWKAITDDHDLDAAQVVQLTEACRAKDRLDQLDRLLRRDVDVWMEIVVYDDVRPAVLVINAALSKANDTANLMKQLLAALRLPDEHGKKPQRHGLRGAQAPTVPGGRGKVVSSLDRARAARSS